LLARYRRLIGAQAARSAALPTPNLFRGLFWNDSFLILALAACWGVFVARYSTHRVLPAGVA
jgi:hypothetical protein